MTVRIHLLGQVCLEAGDEVLPASALPGRQGRLAFAYLALAKHPVSRGDLADVVWADDLPKSWERDLSAIVSKLKAQLTRIGVPDPIRSALGCYELVLPPDTVVDVEAAFTHLEDAEAVLRAGDPARAWGAASAAFNLASRPFLPGESGEWVDARREELTTAAVRAADTLAVIEAHREHWPDACRYAEEAIGRAPYRESGYVRLIDVHLGAGNRAEALRAYERARTLLAEELGVPPSAPLEEAYRRALSADAAPDASEPVPAVERRPLVGRRRELEVVRAALVDAVGGRGRLVLVAGEPGVGKTALAEAVAADATAQGVAVAWASCWAGEGAPPLWPWTQVLREAAELGRVDDAELLAQVTDGAERTSLLGDVDPSGARFRLFDRTFAALRRASAPGPVVVVLDDLHWADRTSLQLLSFVARSVRSLRVLLIGTYRHTEVEPTDALAELLDDVPRDSERLMLRGLHRGEIAELATSIIGAPASDDLEDVLIDHAGGNPFFVKELLRLLDAQGRLGALGQVPAGVREVLDRRLARLTPRCHDALGVGAVIGRSFDPSLLADATGMTHDEVSEVIDEAASSGVVSESGPDRVTFVHELFRQALYDGLGRARRLRLHLDVGTAIERRASGDATAHVAELAHHFLASAGIGDLDHVIDAVERAGMHAARVLAFDEASDWYARALELLGDRDTSPRRLRLLVDRGEAQWRAQDVTGARVTLASATSLARALDDGDVFARAALALGGGLGGAQPLADPDAELISLLDEALGRLGERDSVLRCRVLARLSAELSLTDEVARRDALSAEAVAVARRLADDAALATALYARQIAVYGPDGLPDREAVAEEMLALAADSRDQELAFWGHLFRVWSRTERCLPVDDDLAACARLADELGVATYRAEVAIRRAVVALVAGRFDEVDRQLAQVDGAAAGAASSTLLSLTVLTSWLRGPLDELEPMVVELVRAHPDRPLWRAALATLYVELGRDDAARSEIDALVGTGAALPRDGLWLFAMQFLALVCTAARDRRLADELFPLVLPYAEQAPVGALGSAMTTIGLLDAARGNTTEGLAWLDRAESRNLAHGNLAFALWTRRERAAVLLARDGQGDRESAAAELASLVTELRDRGFHGFLVRAERLLTDARA